MKNLIGDKAAATPQQRNHTYHSLKLFTNKHLFKDKLMMQKYSAQLESELRKVVREVVEQAFQRISPQYISRSLGTDQFEASKSRHFKLQFEGKLPHRIFTGSKVVAEGNSQVKILLLDAVTGHRVTNSPLSSKRVEVVVLHGHFKTELLEDWTKMEFQRNLVSNRAEKGALLVGKRFVTLQDGIGFIDDINFTDNSSWVRSKMFRLGGVLVGQEDQVREAVTCPFKVKDRRGESYQKHKIPALEDEVWRLRGIAKDGKICQRLKDNHIYKVKDLVTLYYNNNSLLGNILNVSPRKRKAIIQQATTCLPDQECTNLSNIPETCNSIGTTINNSVTVPCLNLQQYHVPPSGHQAIVTDQPEYQISQSHAGEHSHQLNQSTMVLDNSLVETSLLASSYNDDHYCSGPYYLVPQSPASNRFDAQTSMVQEDTNFFQGSTSNYY